MAHETRDLLNTAILAYQTLKRGTVAINGSCPSPKLNRGETVD